MQEMQLGQGIKSTRPQRRLAACAGLSARNLDL